MDASTPHFQHDCSACEFLGSAEYPSFHHGGEVVKADLYVCRKSVIARYSDEPSEYSSSPINLVGSLLCDAGLLIAAQLILSRGGVDGSGGDGYHYFKDGHPVRIPDDLKEEEFQRGIDDVERKFQREQEEASP